MGRGRRLALIVLAAGSLAVAAIVAGCESPAERRVQPAPAGSLTVLFSHDNQGVLSSCGCPTNPSGGFAKRQTMIDKYRGMRPDVVVVDAGDLFPERPNAMKVKYLAQALGRAKYDAVAAGDQELGMGLEELRSLVAEHHLPLICANVRDRAGNLVFPPHVIRQVGGLRIGIFAVIADEVMGFPPREWRKGLRIEPPLEAARREAAALADCDLVIALSHQPIVATETLARSVPGIRVVVSGHDPAIFRKPLELGGATVAASGPVGREIGALTFTPVPEGALAMSLEMIGLSEKTVRDAPWVLDMYWEYVRKAKGEAPPDWVLAPQPAAYESSDQCGKCHEAQYKQWLTTRHAKSYATIKRVGRHEDPECILCHTMGYGRQNGFFSMEETPALGSVTCQACHPVTSKHGSPGEKVDAKFAPRTFIDARLCINCHGLIESPDFDYYAYRPKIVHRQVQVEK
ncbi:MAG: multiheme c-type cytochrome [Planctomycetota bacterium]|nr:multiheme c-type cytochrome [Planctomycetota bacterium]